jgi:hypothetical protein
MCVLNTIMAAITSEIVAALLSHMHRPEGRRTMLRLTTRRREVLLEKGPDMANLAMGGLVFGQFLSPEPFSLPVALGGLGVWIAVMGLAIAFAEEPQ